MLIRNEEGLKYTEKMMKLKDANETQTNIKYYIKKEMKTSGNKFAELSCRKKFFFLQNLIISTFYEY